MCTCSLCTPFLHNTSHRCFVKNFFLYFMSKGILIINKSLWHLLSSYLCFPALSARNLRHSLVSELSIPSRSVISLSVSFHLLSVMCHFVTSGPTNNYHNLARAYHIRAGTTTIFKNRTKVTLMQLTPGCKLQSCPCLIFPNLIFINAIQFKINLKHCIPQHLLCWILKNNKVTVKLEYAQE